MKPLSRRKNRSCNKQSPEIMSPTNVLHHAGCQKHFTAYLFRLIMLLPVSVLIVVTLLWVVQDILMFPDDMQYLWKDIPGLILLIALALGLVSVWIGKNAARHLRNQCHTLQKRLEKAVASGQPIKQEDIEYEEFDTFRRGINAIIEDSRAREVRFRDVAESMAGWIWEVDAQGRYTYSSDHVKDFLGYTPAEILGKTPFDLMESQEAQYIGEIFRQIHEQKQPFKDLENWWLTKDGNRICLSTSGVPILDAQGALIGYRGVDSDITERKLAEESLKLRAQQQAEIAKFGQLALSGIPLDNLLQKAVTLLAQVLGTKYVMILEHWPEHNVLFLRDGMGWKEGWIRNKSLPDSTDSQGGYTMLQDRPVITEDINRETRFMPPILLTEHNVVSSMTVTIPGTERHFGILGVHTDQMRRFSVDDTHFLEIIANILAGALKRKRAEDALQEERNRLRSIVDAMDGMGNMLTIQDRDYNIIYQNSLMERTCGGLGNKCYKIYERNEKVCDDCPVKKAFKDGQSHSSERLVKVPGGEEASYFEVTAHPVRNAAGEIISCIEIVRNIDERKRSEELLKNRVQQQAEVAKFGQLALSGLSLDELFQDAVTLVSQVLGMKYAEVLEHQPEQQVLLLQASVGWKEGWIGHKSVPDGTGSQSGYTLLQNKPVITEDMNKETRFLLPDLLSEHKVVGGMTVVISGTDRPFGVLGVYTDRIQRFSEDNVHFLEAIANILAGALKRKRAEDALQEEKNRLRSIVDAMDGMDNMLTIQDRDYNIIYQNSITECTFGGLGDKCYKIYERKEQVCEGCPVEKAFRDGRSHSSERHVIVPGEGDMTYFETSAHPVRNAAGEIISCIEVVRNIHERKCMEEARDRLIDRQGQLNCLQQKLLGPSSFQDKLKQMTDGVVKIFDAEFCRIWITRPGDSCESGCIHAHTTEEPYVCRHRDQCLHLMASSGRYTHIDGKEHRRVPLGCYTIGRIAFEQDGKLITNEAGTNVWIHNHDWVKEHGLVSFAVYQLRLPSGESTGVLALFSKHPITPEDDVLLENLANTATQIIQSTQVKEHIQQLATITEQTAD